MLSGSSRVRKFRSKSAPDVSRRSQEDLPEVDYYHTTTPNNTPEESPSLDVESKDARLRNLVVLTQVTNFLPCHILNILIGQEYVVRGVITHEDQREDVESLFEIHPSAREYLYVVQASPTSEKEWERVVDRAKYVIHMVSPKPQRSRRDRTGHHTTLDILKKLMNACAKMSVERFILISSVASIAWSSDKELGHDPFNEGDWECEDNLNSYAKCQLACEKAAWQFMQEKRGSWNLDLVVLNPAFILGPVIQGRTTNSVALIKALMEGEMEEILPKSLPIVDVRDVAQAAAVALNKHAAVGHRHILCGSTVSLVEIVFILKREFNRQGYRICTRTDKATPSQGNQCCPLQKKKKSTIGLENAISEASNQIFYDNSRMKCVLGLEPRNPDETIIETAYSLIHWDFVSKPDPARRAPSGKFQYA